jgi:hypothetical protein
MHSLLFHILYTGTATFFHIYKSLLTNASFIDIFSAFVAIGSHCTDSRNGWYGMQLLDSLAESWLSLKEWHTVFLPASSPSMDCCRSSLSRVFHALTLI